eukprot:TRINITY_DN5154_c0_g1_i2.p1 TRINITY_DN5154_c0_g1~~TRINITY_DN5154_c0_g1_i2.p1  ORF type:complete len:339 (-),score=32.08 TRINITY_DN5154_c0_g1_i2:81-962(-)
MVAVASASDGVVSKVKSSCLLQKVIRSSNGSDILELLEQLDLNATKRSVQQLDVAPVQRNSTSEGQDIGRPNSILTALGTLNPAFTGTASPKALMFFVFGLPLVMGAIACCSCYFSGSEPLQDNHSPSTSHLAPPPQVQAGSSPSNRQHTIALSKDQHLSGGEGKRSSVMNSRTLQDQHLSGGEGRRCSVMNSRTLQDQHLSGGEGKRSSLMNSRTLQDQHPNCGEETKIPRNVQYMAPSQVTSGQQSPQPQLSRDGDTPTERVSLPQRPAFLQHEAAPRRKTVVVHTVPPRP